MGYYFTPRSYDYKTSLGINGIDEGRSIFVLDNNITCTDDNYERLYQKVGRCDEALNPIIEQANAECYNVSKLLLYTGFQCYVSIRIVQIFCFCKI